MNRPNFLKSYHGVARLEYVPAEAPGLVIPILMAASSFSDFLRQSTIEAMVAFFLLFVSGFLINSLTDIEVDARYKTRVSGSVHGLGKRNLKLILAAHVLAAVVLACHVAYLVDNYLILVLVAIGLFLGLGYSVRPFHFKVRGPLHAVALAFSAFFIPGMFLYISVRGELPGIGPIVVLSGFTILHYAIALTNQVGDYLEDRDANLRTPAVWWGLTPTLRMALAASAAGLVVLAAGVIYLFSGLDTSQPTIAAAAALAVPVVLILGYQVPLRGMLDQLKIATTPDRALGRFPDRERMDRIKARMNYPKWQASGIYSLFGALGVMFILTAGFPAVHDSGPILSPLSTSPTIGSVDVEYSADGQTAVVEVVLNTTGYAGPFDGLRVCTTPMFGDRAQDAASTFLTDRALGMAPGRYSFTQNVALGDAPREKTGFTVELSALNGTVLDRTVIEPEMEFFIMEASAARSGVLGTTMDFSVTVYNAGPAVDVGAADAAVAALDSSFTWLTVHQANNGTIPSGSSWTFELALDYQMIPLDYDIVLTLNGEEADQTSIMDAS